MSNIDIFIRTAEGERKSFASLNSAAQVIEMRELLKEVGVYCGIGYGNSTDITLQAICDEDAGFEFIVTPD